jgi:dephospho-CoA kinase
MSFLLGLTGSIGMGKSTTAGFFKDAGCDVWNADAAVHRLYAKQGAAVAPLSNLFPKALIEGAISRQVLKQELQKNPDLIGQLEAIVHPLVAQDRQKFIDSAQSDILVFDIPLLFETGADVHMNAVICVTIDEKEQKKRVLERGTMNEEMFEQVKSRQWSNSQKCEKADFVILTDTLEHVHAQVESILAKLRAVKDA